MSSNFPGTAEQISVGMPAVPTNNFELVNVNSGKCLDVQGGGNTNNTNIIQFDCNGGTNQRWFIGYTQ